MKELDFDELDKAVNSLMAKTGNDPVEQPKSLAPETSASTPSSSAAAADEPATVSTSQPEVATSPKVSQRLEATSPAARPFSIASMPTKRSGRFMDVVHPSSDMTKSNTTPTPTRHGSSLSPLSANVAPESPAPVQSTGVLSEVTDPMVVEESAQVTPKDPASHDWPDPLDMHPSVHDEDTSEAPKEPTSPVEESEEAAPAPQALVVESAPVSPFLTDAKVEKRPLGGSAAPTSTVLEEAVSLTPNDSLTQHDPADQTPPPAPLPAELHDELLKIESDTPVVEQSPSSSVNQPALSSAHGDEPNAAPTGPISIAQQYKQQPRSGDQSHVAMYDNAAHPLTHPAKSKSGWLTVVIIVLIILIGGGGAAALFFLGYV